MIDIAVKIAKFSKNEGVAFLKSLIKRDPKTLKLEKIKFIESAKSNSISKEKALKIYDLMKYYVGLIFERKHIEKAAYLTYKMAYLKAHYPNEFMASVRFNNMYD